jgi:hypothetical protein
MPSVRELPQPTDLASADRFDAELDAAMGVLNAAGARLVELIVRCLASEWWAVEGTHGPVHWVMARCGLDRSRAGRLVRIAQELDSYPATAAAFAAGQLTEAHVHVIVTRCDPRHEAALVEAAPHCNIPQLSRLVRMYPKPEPEPEPEPDAGAAVPRDVVSFAWGDDGRFHGVVDLGPEIGSLLERTLESARAVVFAERADGDGAIAPADVLARLCHAALHGLDPSTRAGHRPSDRFQVVLHVDADAPADGRLHLGPLLVPSMTRYLTCDADVRAILWRDGRPVAKGRRSRVVDTVLRRLVEDRDQGCRICGRRGFLHVHHLVHWADGGPTDPDNLIAVCTACHRSLHDGTIRVVGDPMRPDGLEVLDRAGRPWIRPAPRPPGPLPDSPTYGGPIRGDHIRWSTL